MSGEKNIEQKIIPNVENLPSKFETKENSENKTEKVFLESDKNFQDKKLIKPTIDKQEVSSAPINNFQKEQAEEIDKILEAGLDDVFLQLDKKQQKDFKKKGEKTVNQINELLNKTKVKINKIIELIRIWLKLIPGVNKFFLEQEAKIKANKILKIKNRF